MPLLKFHMIKGRTEAEVGRVLDVAHEAMLRAFQVPDRDRYQIVHEHEASHFRALDTGLDIPRTAQFILVEVVSRPRTRETKLAFYEGLCADWHSVCGIAPSDVMISFTQNSDEDWSFGNGKAHFIAGLL